MNHSKLISFIFCIITLVNGYSQDSTTTVELFEGKVTYIHQILSPNKGLISEEEFFRDMPNAGKSIVTLYVKAKNRILYSKKPTIGHCIETNSRLRILYSSIDGRREDRKNSKI
jgi:hypothetical protein